MNRPIFFYQNREIKKVLIVGLGISGFSVFKWFNQYDVIIDTYDQKHYEVSTNAYFDDFNALELMHYDLIVVAPGIPINKAPFNRLSQYWDKVVGDIELFALEVKPLGQKMLAISGSNGKSTTVSLLYHVLRDLDIKVALGGNIGTPALSLIDPKVQVYVLEISSFQIDLLKKAQFDVGCVLNISPDHLDRYPNYAAYCQSKLKLFEHSHYKVTNGKQRELTLADKANMSYFNSKDCWIDGKTLFFQGQLFCTTDELLLQGAHNLENILAVLLVLESLMDLNEAAWAKIKQSIRHFRGLPHRCQLVATINGVKYINDSKGTNIGAVEAALNGLAQDEKNIIIFLGGLAKGADFSMLIPALKKSVKKAIIYGQDRLLITKALEKDIECIIYPHLDEAFATSFAFAKQGDIVLLSPGCASFDAFSGFVQRGEYFEQLVNQYKVQ